MGMKGFSTNFGEPLSNESKRLTNEVRLRINQPIHPNFDTDFNIYRFIMNAERVHKKEKDIIESAAKNLNNHLKIRKALSLDTLPDVPFDENPIFSRRLLPKGEILSVTDSSNRLLWYVEYATINVEALAHTIRSSQSIKYQFVQFEHMLRRVNKQEERTGRLSGLRHIIDLTGYEINPFTMLFVSNGSLSYYSQLLHYDNYPELVSPIELVNVAKWVHVPYKIAKTMMPTGFTDRFRLHDDNFLPTLQKEIRLEDIPDTLGGKNKSIRCQPAIKATPDQHWTPKDLELLSTLETFHVSPRKSKQIHVDVAEAGKRFSWYYSTDGDILFGAFYQPFDESTQNKDSSHGARSEKEIDPDSLEMVYPWLKLAARIVHEMDSIECTRPGRYWLIFCNRFSWMQRRTINLTMQLSDGVHNKRYHTDGTFSCAEPFEISEL